MMPQVLLTFLIILFVPMIGQADRTQPSVEILIPEGMPIKLEVRRDHNEFQIVKYIIKRIVPKDALQAKIITVMVDDNGMIKFMSPVVGGQLNDPMSIATGDRSVARILLIVEWLKTERGKWMIDTKTQQLDIEMLVKRGAEVLPRSKFIAKNSHKAEPG